jgi:hypothetical protein
MHVPALAEHHDHAVFGELAADVSILAQLAQLEGNFSYFARGGVSQINWLGVARG